MAFVKHESILTLGCKVEEKADKSVNAEKLNGRGALEVYCFNSIF